MYPDEHCKKAPELLREAGIDDKMIHAIVSHGYGLCSDVKPEHEVEKVLTPELYTGLAPEQTENFVKNYIKPILDSHKDELGIKIELTV